MSSNLDAGLVYRPPNSLQFPKGMEPKVKAESRAGSPNSSSSSQSDLSFSPTLKRDGQFVFPVSGDDGAVAETTAMDSVDAAKEQPHGGGGSFENESDSTSTGGHTVKQLKSTESSSSQEGGGGDVRRFPKTPVSNF